MSDVIEVKAEGIGEVADAGEVAALREEVAGLKARVEAGALRAGRAPLDGIKAAGGGSGRSAFVERYLRRGLDAGVEMKSVTGTTGADGGFAVPREIDEAIETLLKTISPIRAIASVVATGSAGYRKLVAAGGTPSGRAMRCRSSWLWERQLGRCSRFLRLRLPRGGWRTGPCESHGCAGHWPVSAGATAWTCHPHRRASTTG